MATQNLFDSLRLTLADFARWVRNNPDRADDLFQIALLFIIIPVIYLLDILGNILWLPVIAFVTGLAARFISRVLIRALPFFESGKSFSVMLTKEGKLKDY
jgi:hypothetical protein